MPSPLTTKCAARRRRSAGRLFTVVALGGVLLALGVATALVLRRTPGAATPPATPRAATRGTATLALQTPLPLEARIRAAVARLAATKTVTLPLIDGDDLPVTAATVAVASRFLTRDPTGALPPDASTVEATVSAAGVLLRVAARWPDLELLSVGARDVAARQLPPLILPDGDVELDPLRLVAGARLRGRLIGPEQRPVSGARVVLVPLASDALARAVHTAAPLAETTSNDRGEFEFPQVGPSVVRLEVESSEGSANGGVPEVTPGPAPATIELASRAAAMSGVVVDSAGAPIPGATLVANNVSLRRPSSQAAVSDADGGFTFDRLAAGYYTVDAEAPGFARAQIRRAHSGTVGVTVTLIPLAMAQLEIVGAPRDLAIPVLWQTLAPDGKWRRPTSRLLFGELRDGKLRLRDVPIGRHSLEVRIPGAAPFECAAVEFAPGSTTELGSFTLEAGATLIARVTGPDGQPRRARATLAARYQAGRMAARDLFALDDREERSLRADGSLQWEALPAGTRTLALRAAGCADRNLVVELPASGLLDLGTIALDGAGAIEGVVRRMNGVPLGDAAVQAEQVGGVLREALTGADGRYRFDRLPAGRYEVRLLPIDDLLPTRLDPSAPPREPQSARLDVAPGDVTRRDFTLDP